MADNIRNDGRHDDDVQHGIDDNPHGDAGKGALLGGIGGAVVGALAGGPVGAVVGAVAGAAASGAGVAAVDAVDNDNTVSGIGHSDHDHSNVHTASTVGTTGTLRDNNDTLRTDSTYTGTAPVTGTTGYTDQSYGSGSLPISTAASGTDVNRQGDVGGHNIVTGDASDSNAGETGLATGAVAGGLIGTAVGGPVGAVVGGTIGSLAGGVAGDATEADDDDLGRNRGTGTNNMNTGVTDYDTLRTDLMGADYETRPYGTYGGRNISRTEYNQLPETDRQSVQLLEEELHVDKQVRQIGEVEISKRVVEEQVQVPVTLEREEVVVRVHEAGGDARGTIGDDQTIVVPVREEVANVTKEVHVTGEVEVEKHRTTENQTITDTVRREEIEVEGANGRNVRVEDDTNRL